MTTPGPELPEKDFISEGYSKNPLPLWLWFFLLTALIALLWGVGNWYSGKINLLTRSSPFLQVTNREMSLYLWQNPEFMRVNVKEKNGYLPAFQYTDKITVNVADADQYVVAPPELLFRYHTWNRLVSSEFTQRPIPLQEFREFLGYAQEWHPMYWTAAPQGYVRFVEGLSKSTEEDLSKLSEQVMPMPVRMAFQGWLNYFKEGDAINALEPSERQMYQFLENHAHYARNYWRNVVEDTFPNYLVSMVKKGTQSDEVIPKTEIAPFLRVAVFNYLKAEGASNPVKAIEEIPKPKSKVLPPPPTEAAKK